MKQIKSTNVTRVNVNGVFVELIGCNGEVLETINARFKEMVSFVANEAEFQMNNQEYIMIDDVNASSTEDTKVTETRKIKSSDVAGVKVNGTVVEIVDQFDKVVLTIDAGFEDFVSFIVNDILEQKETEEFITVVV